MTLSPTAPAGLDEPTRSRFLALALVVLVTAAALRLAGLDRSLSVDEAFTVRLAATPDFWTAARSDVHPPFYYFFVRLAQSVATAAPGLRLTSVISGLGLVALAVFSLRKMPVAATVAGTAFAALPGFVLYSQQLRPYALLLLLLAVALLLAARIAHGEAGLRPRILLCLALTTAAAIHLVTVFYLLALAPLLLQPSLKAGPRGWIVALLPLVPPGLFAVGLKLLFITPPQSLGGGWWIPVDATATFHAARDAFGWSELQWMADAWSRHAPGGVWPVILGAQAAALVAIATAWGRRHAPPLVWMLLLVATIYWAVVTVYSCLAEPVIMMRTLLPGLLPFFAGLAVGISTHPVAWRRALAVGAVACYATLTAVPVVRLAFVPETGLREFAAVTKAASGPGDLLVAFRAMDYSLAVYDCPPPGTDLLFFDQTLPAAPQLVELHRRLANLGARNRVLFAYRDDHYFRNFREVFDQAVAEVARHRQTPAVVSTTSELVLLVAGPAH